MNPKSPNFKHPNFGISELRTSRTLLLSSRPELNELEHPKNVKLRTRTHVRSNTNVDCIIRMKKMAIFLSTKYVYSMYTYYNLKIV